MAKRQVLLVAGLFALSGTGAVLVVAAAPVVGVELAGGPSLATLPVALAMLGGLAATVPASQAMASWGRRAGFSLFTTIGLAGAATASLAIHLRSFTLFCVGSVGIGAMNGASLFYRFTAAEVAEPTKRERATGYVLGAGVVAGIAGPSLANLASDALPARFAGSYAVLAALALVVLLLLPFLQAPRPHAPPASARHALRRLLPDRRFQAAVVAGAAAYAAMVLTMVAAPLSLRHGGHPFSTSALVIQAHVVAMYLPSFVSGRLVERAGPLPVIVAGFAALGGCIAVNLLGDSAAHHTAALVLLGVGWNFLFVAATAMLVRSHADNDRAAAQGANDFLVSLCATGAALLAGPIHATLGWGGLNLAVGGLLAVAAVALVALSGKRGEAPARPATS